MLQPLALFTWVLWTLLLLSVDLLELLFTSTTSPGQPRNKQICAKRMDFLQLQQTDYAAWVKPHNIDIALAAPQGG
jgi:hypothetical protein